MEKMTGALKVLDEVHDRAIERMSPSQCEKGIDALEAVAAALVTLERLAAHVRPTCTELYDEAVAALARVRSS